MQNAPSAELSGQYGIELRLTGHVQGVGFRPFVHRLASEYQLDGHVQNRLGEVEIAVAGDGERVSDFCRDLIARAPPLSNPTIARQRPLEVRPAPGFEIVASTELATPRVSVPPDYFMCDECRAELADPRDRRYQYPFINCVQCGPRYTLIEALPYDRPNTSMAEFPLCAACEAEYRDPADRRFHAEPVACPDCGPQLTFVEDGRELAGEAIEHALRFLKAGKVVAVKGVGGYHLMCDARNEAAVALLRSRKHRPHKPLAVMFPLAGDDGLANVLEHIACTAEEAVALAGPLRPIVLVAKRPGTVLASNIAPGLAEIGAFLPYSPLHQLLLERFDGPLVATSGNISGEPVVTDNTAAELQLAPIADALLHHDRRIVRPADDSVLRRVAGALRPIRIGRGMAPYEFELPWQQPVPTLAVGGQDKVTVTLSWGRRVVVSPHIGDMGSPRSLALLERVVDDLQQLYRVRAQRVICDAHPGYTTHRWARRQRHLPVATAWHHHAHASALAAEFPQPGPRLVFAWDGVGLGEDGTLWGGEALLGNAGHWRRVASMRPFCPPGGERVAREPWRSAAAMLWACGEDWAASPDRDGLAKAAWRAQLNSPSTSAVGRLFDAAAALILEMPVASFEAAGPMRLEAICRTRGEPLELPLARDEDGIWRTDWQPLLAVITDNSLSRARRAEDLHATLAVALLRQAQVVCAATGVTRIGLCGGVFQNRVLTEHVIDLLRADDFIVDLPLRLPCNDASLGVGQAAELAARDARSGA